MSTFFMSFFLSYCISYFTTVEFTLFVVKNMLIRGTVTLWVTGLLQNIHIANNLRGRKFVGKGIPENLSNLTPHPTPKMMIKQHM